MTTDVTLGAWKFGGGTYHYIPRDRMGVIPDPDLSEYDALRVNLAVQAIQRQLDVKGFDPHRFDGIFGYWTKKAVLKYHKSEGIFVGNGAVGRTTMGELLRPLVRRNATHYGVPKEIMAGIPIHESGWDPAAVGASTPPELGRDRGLFQINSLAHPDVSDEDAFDAVFNLSWGAQSLSTHHSHYMKLLVDRGAENPDEQAWDCAILANLNPSSAEAYAKDGTIPSEKGLKFIEDTKAYGVAYWSG